MPDEQAIVHGACIQFLTHSTGLTTHRNPSLWGLVLLPPFSCGLFLFLVVYKFVSVIMPFLFIFLCLSFIHGFPFLYALLVFAGFYCCRTGAVYLFMTVWFASQTSGLCSAFPFKVFKLVLLACDIQWCLCYVSFASQISGLCSAVLGSLHVCMLVFLFLTFSDHVFVMRVCIALLPHEFPQFQYSLHASVFLCTIPRPGYSVGRAPVCCAAGRGCDPQTGQTLRVLNNWGECAAFVIISANG